MLKRLLIKLAFRILKRYDVASEVHFNSVCLIEGRRFCVVHFNRTRMKEGDIVSMVLEPDMKVRREYAPLTKI